jgi:hypothetical protein
MGDRVEMASKIIDGAGEETVAVNNEEDVVCAGKNGVRRGRVEGSMEVKGIGNLNLGIDRALGG